MTVLIRRFYFSECSFIFIYRLDKGLFDFAVGSFTWMSSFLKGVLFNHFGGLPFFWGI